VQLTSPVGCRRRVKRADAQFLVDIPFNDLDSHPAILGRRVRSGQRGGVLPRRRRRRGNYLNECLNLGHQLVLPLRGAPLLADDAAIAARGRIDAAPERFLSDGPVNATVRVDLNATGIIMCAAMISQPRPYGAGWSTIARRHIGVFVNGIRATADRPLPGPPVTHDDIEAMFRGTPRHDSA
jgi:hypothetical protein